LHGRAAADRARREHKERLWLAWHIAALMNARRLPRLADLMQDELPPDDRTPEGLVADFDDLDEVASSMNRARS